MIVFSIKQQNGNKSFKFAAKLNKKFKFSVQHQSSPFVVVVVGCTILHPERKRRKTNPERKKNNNFDIQLFFWLWQLFCFFLFFLYKCYSVCLSQYVCVGETSQTKAKNWENGKQEFHISQLCVCLVILKESYFFLLFGLV